jgi:hypothetical protein
MRIACVFFSIVALSVQLYIFLLWVRLSRFNA